MTSLLLMVNLRTRFARVPILMWLGAGVLVLAFALRIFGLDQFPPGVQHDEVFVANFAQTILGGQYPIFFELNRGNEPLFMYLVAVMFKLFGQNVFALRATAALCGTGAIVLTYLLVREMFGKGIAASAKPSPAGEGSKEVLTPLASGDNALPNGIRVSARHLSPTGEESNKTSGDFIALVTVAGIAVSFWDLYESRIGLHTISTYLLAAATFYVFWRGWTRGNRILLLASGVLAGLATYTYRSGIFVPAALLVFVLYTLIFHRKVWGKNLWLIPVIFILAGLVYAPLFYYITSHPDTALARLSDLSGDMDSLRQGNPVPMLTNVVRVFGMFGVSGDPEWRYNVALRPIFDPLWAILFYLGILLCIWRFKRAPYAFALVWLVVMLLPSILSGSDLSQHRAVGAIGAAFIMPALVLDEIRAWVTKRWNRAGQLALGVGVAGLVVVAAYWGLYGYFVTWTNNPEVRLIQRADLAEAAHWLDEHQGNDRTFVSAEFANDLDRGSFNLEARNQNRAQFFQGADTFVLPARTNAFIVNTRSGPINDSFQKQFLADAPVYEAKMADGQTELSIYELTEAEFQILRTIRGLSTAAQTQDGQISILDLNAPGKASTGARAPTELWWKIGTPQLSDADGLLWKVMLQDALNYVWADASSMGYTPSEWQPDDIVVSQLALDVPPDAPPGAYGLNVALDSSHGVIPLAQRNTPPANSVQLATLNISRGAVPASKPDLAIRYPSKAKFGDIELLGSDALGDAAAGGTWRLILFWKADAKIPSNYQLRLTATTDSGQKITQQQDTLSKAYPTKQWRVGDYVRTIQDLPIPVDAPRGKAVVRVALVTPDGKPVGRADGAPIAGIEIGGRTHDFDKPTPQNTLSAQFSGAIELVGYDLDKQQYHAGEPMNLKLYWHALKPADKPYTVFVHLLDANGKVIGQKDSPPMNGDAPTDSWQANEYLGDEYSFDIAPDALVGSASIEIGFYDAVTGARLPVMQNGQASGDHLEIAGLKIE